MIQTPNLPLAHPAWKVAHECYLAAVSRQTATVRDILAAQIGDTFEAFLDALADRLLVISSHFLDDGLNYLISVRGAEEYLPIAKIHASRLGLDDDETKFAELLNNG